MKIRVGGEWRDIIGAKIRQAGSWRTIQAVKIFSGGVWRSAGTYSPTGTPGGMTLTITPESATVTATGAVLETGEAPLAKPSNGSKPYTYLWETLSSTGPGTVEAENPTFAVTDIIATFSSTGTITATVQCTCTDKVGSVASDTIALTFIRTA